jgi:hypothetical protein
MLLCHCGCGVSYASYASHAAVKEIPVLYTTFCDNGDWRRQQQQQQQQHINSTCRPVIGLISLPLLRCCA